MKTLNTEQLKQWKQSDKDFLLLNVLDRNSFESQHIPGSQNIPVESSGFEQATEKVAGSKQRPVVVYCASPKCDASERAAKKLDKAGFEQVLDYEGGVKAWQEAGESVSSGAAT